MHLVIFGSFFYCRSIFGKDDDNLITKRILDEDDNDNSDVEDSTRASIRREALKIISKPTDILAEVTLALMLSQRS